MIERVAIVDTAVPTVLGRGLVLPSEADIPKELRDLPIFLVDEEALLHPQDIIHSLHRHWLERQSVVIRLGIDKELLKTPERLDVEPYTLDPQFEFSQFSRELTWNIYALNC